MWNKPRCGGESSSEMEIRICGIYAMNVSCEYNRGLKISNIDERFKKG